MKHVLFCFLITIVFGQTLLYGSEFFKTTGKRIEAGSKKAAMASEDAARVTAQRAAEEARVAAQVRAQQVAEEARVFQTKAAALEERSASAGKKINKVETLKKAETKFLPKAEGRAMSQTKITSKAASVQNTKNTINSTVESEVKALDDSISTQLETLDKNYKEVYEQGSKFSWDNAVKTSGENLINLYDKYNQQLRTYRGKKSEYIKAGTINEGANALTKQTGDVALSSKFKESYGISPEYVSRVKTEYQAAQQDLARTRAEIENATTQFKEAVNSVSSIGRAKQGTKNIYKKVTGKKPKSPPPVEVETLR